MNKYENAIQCLQVMKGAECINALSQEFPEHYGIENIEALELAIEVLKKNQWIPCSERLPEDNIDVLIQPAWAEDVWHLERASYEDDKWHCCCNTFDKEEIIAWMPLPKPYKAGD